MLGAIGHPDHGRVNPVATYRARHVALIVKVIPEHGSEYPKILLGSQTNDNRKLCCVAPGPVVPQKAKPGPDAPVRTQLF